MKEIGRDAFVRVDNPKKFIFRSTTPPSGYISIPSVYINRAEIYLPKASIKAYASSNLLREYYNLESKAHPIE